ncbi:hypothetical protein GOV10_00565, partial [Candidatus Woesearchaeota archaeon]|nr:hypothetical protein [Candidatus Woesearchaeota archaeon]
MRTNKTFGITFTLLSIILLLALAIVMPAEATMVVNKYTNDFTLSSPNNEQLKACSCEMKTDLLIIENVGNFPANYVMEIISPVAEWMTLSEEEFSLAPKHRKELINYVEVPCGEKGVSDYVVRVTSSYGRTEYLHRTLRVDQCQNVVLSVAPKEYTTNLCQPVDYDVRVKNVGTYAETYQLGFGSYDEYMNVTLKEFYLKPGEAYEQTAVLTLPCTFYGEYDIPFYALGSKNNVQDEETVLLIVENQFDHSINVDTEAKLCSQVKQEIAVIVKNEIDIPNDFNVRLRGPGFVDVKDAERTFSLEGDETRVLILEADPKEGQEGEYTLSVEVSSDYGKVMKTRDVQLVVKNCYDFEVELRDIENNVLDGATACCGMREYLLNIRNRGETEETYNIMTDAPSWFRPEELTVRLLPGESTNVRLYADLPCVDASYALPLTVINNRFNEVNETIVFNLNGQTKRSCHMVMINDDEFNMQRDTQVIPLIVEHNGTEGGLYELSIDSQLFTLQETSIEIWPGEKKVIHLETVENLTDHEFGRYISQPLFTYTLENNPLATVTEDIDYNEHVGTNLKDKNLFVKAWEYLAYGVNWCAPGMCGWTTIVFATLLALALITMAVLALMTVKPTVHPASISAFRIILLALVIIVFILLAIVKLPDPATLYEMPEDAAEHFVTVYQDGRVTVDLDPYFTDPDQDVLDYTATQPKDLAVYIDGNEMTLVPDRGFAGENEIVITANDGKGGVEDSPVLSIYVVPMKDMDFMAWWMRFCVQINIFLLLLLLLLTLIMTFMFDERKTAEKKRVYVVIPQHGEYKVTGRKKTSVA